MAEIVTCALCGTDHPENSDEVTRLSGEPVCADEPACWDRIYREARGGI